MLINKNDIAKLVKFSVNIPDVEINPFILKAERTLPRLVSGTYDEFRHLAPIVYSQFESNVVVPAGEFREFGGLIWRTLTNANSIPDKTNAEWVFESSYSMLFLYVKPYLVFRTYDYFLAVHGIDITPAGITQQTGERFTPVAENRRKEIIASNRTDLNNAEMDLLRVLDEYGYLPKPDSCVPSRGTSGRFGFGVVRRKRR